MIQAPHSEGKDLNHAATPAPRGFLAIGIFLFFGAAMAGLAATTLIWRGTPLDRVWTLNPRAYRQLVPMGATVGVPFAVLCAALAAAGIGWFQRRRWGWQLAVAIVAVQILGDIVNCVRGDWLRGGSGVVIAGALLVFMVRRETRAGFV